MIKKELKNGKIIGRSELLSQFSSFFESTISLSGS